MSGPTLRSPYFVCWGYMHKHFAHVATFPLALALYVLHYRDEGGAEIQGEGADGDSDEDGFHLICDGLTDDERNAIDEIDCQEAA